MLPEPASIPACGIHTEVFSNHDLGFAAYAAFCEQAIYAAPQHPLWIKSWLGGTDKNCLIVLIWKDGHPAMALALEVIRCGVYTLAVFPGASHANSNFPAIASQSLVFEDLLAAILDIRAARPDIDSIILERQRLSLNGHPNPLLQLRHITSPNLALAVNLDIPRRTQILGSARKMKRHRKSRRKLEAAGDVRIFRAQTPAEVDTLFDHFLQWKENHLLQQGLPNVFGPENVQTRFRSLFQDSLAQSEPSFQLYGLEVAGKLRAVNGYSRTSEGYLCKFLAYSEDELTNIGPGEFLTYEILEQACNQGDAVYDFGVGDEAHKRSWYAVESNHADIYLGLTPKGKIFAVFSLALTIIKRLIKRNSVTKGLLKHIRRLSSATARQNR